MAKRYFLTSMVSHQNDPTLFLTRPVSAVVLLASTVVGVWPLGKARRRGASALAR